MDWRQVINQKELQECVTCLKKNGVIVFPTETVYGIGANALEESAVNKIYQAKNRASDNPLIVHVSDKEMIKQVAKDISEQEQMLIDAFMPGPFTLIVHKKDCVPHNVSAGLDTIGIRMPENRIAHKLIQEAGIPIAAPSANISGRPSGTNMQDIIEELQDRVDILIDGGECDIGLESTVVKVVEGIPTILRPGKITAEQIQRVMGKVDISKKIFEKVKKNEKVDSPGMKYRHYAPETECVLVIGTRKEQIEKINLEIAKKKERRIAVIGFEEDKKEIQCDTYLTIGNRDELDNMMKHIFSLLRKVDQMELDLVIIEGVKQEGIGLAIMNRMIRACEYHTI